MRPLLVIVLLAGVAHAEDEIELFDADGDGDIDADDAAILAHAEEVVITDKSDGQKLRESARAVTVIDTKVAKERTADMGEVLSRAQGIQVRRSGGLGSSTRLSLNGLYDRSIRTFVDGVPADLMGFGGGIENIPIGLVQRVDVHRGVVPISLGADALGGAIDLVSDQSWQSGAGASYQVGSFGTHRVNAFTRVRDEETGASFALSGFFDSSDNDYRVDVENYDRLGNLTPVKVKRFHDAYQAAGISGELGIVRRGPIKRALLRLYQAEFDKELQHNLIMSKPFGAATYGELARGAVLTAEIAQGAWKARIVGGVSRRYIDFNDRGTVVYDWLGQPIGDRDQPGELGLESYVRARQTAGFGRFTVERTLGDRQTLRISTAPTHTRRTATDYLHDPAAGRDPLSARSKLTQIVSGVEHELRLLDSRLENIGFAKHYLSLLDGEDSQYMMPFIPVETTVQTVGLGDMVRYAISDRLIAKASYEWSTRLPTGDEIFGDGGQLASNFKLVPERSHNVNLGGRLQTDTLQLDVNGFARLTDNMIMLLVGERRSIYENVYSANVIGVEAGATWVAPTEWASLEGSVTLQDVRNASSEGTFAAYEGDRIPNRPWLLGSLSGTVRQRELLMKRDEASLFANSRYVHSFYRSWESLGTNDPKYVISSQLVHSAGVTYAHRSATPIVGTFEVQNLLDSKVFDNFGVQRPGRAFYLRLTVEM